MAYAGNYFATRVRTVRARHFLFPLDARPGFYYAVHCVNTKKLDDRVGRDWPVKTVRTFIGKPLIVSKRLPIAEYCRRVRTNESLVRDLLGHFGLRETFRFLNVLPFYWLLGRGIRPYCIPICFVRNVFSATYFSIIVYRFRITALKSLSKHRRRYYSFRVVDDFRNGTIRRRLSIVTISASDSNVS